MKFFGKTTNSYGRSYEELAKSLGERERINVSQTTRIIRMTDDLIVVQYHETDVVIFDNAGDVCLNAGEYLTAMTKEKINAFLPAGAWLITEKGHWFLRLEEQTIPFYNGLTFDTNTMQVYALPDEEAEQEQVRAQDKEREKMIMCYVKALTIEQVTDALNSMGGDCWDCSCHVEGETQPLGEHYKNPEHLLMHMEEGYYPGPLLLRSYAVGERSAFALQIDIHWKNMQNIRHYLRRYLKKQLLKGVMV
jgi:hypothetical protein